MTEPDPGDCTDEIGGDLNMAKMLFEKRKKSKVENSLTFRIRFGAILSCQMLTQDSIVHQNNGT